MITYKNSGGTLANAVFSTGGTCRPVFMISSGWNPACSAGEFGFKRKSELSASTKSGSATTECSSWPPFALHSPKLRLPENTGDLTGLHARPGDPEDLARQVE